jgi:hypothetical protein
MEESCEKSYELASLVVEEGSLHDRGSARDVEDDTARRRASRRD